MDLGLDGALGSTEGDGDLRVGQAVHVSQHDGTAVGRGQRQEQASPVVGSIPCRDDGDRAVGLIDTRLEIAWQGEVK